ncbi:hypothetical protein HHK36_008138 [Tetracentron sinense]|uniref:Uncharacterized protein n=1 Tax=Tetracentron sinense TaxID=13715 RepID=A0A834ZJ00_TETSI|nr:hypothetical protein HHK36_008138 [Tetracentron sinense]
MSATRSILSNLHLGTQCRSQASTNRHRFLEISTYNDRRNSPVSRGLLSPSIGRKVHSKSDTKMKMTVYNSAQPGAPLSSGGPPSSSWKNWILGALFSIVLPFLKHKWGPLLALKNEVDMVVDTVERVAEIVEKVAEGVEKVADEVADNLPEGGKLHDALRIVENLAQETAEGAQRAGDLIDKVEAMEDKLESLVESVTDRENVVAAKEEAIEDKVESLVESVTDRENAVTDRENVVAAAKEEIEKNR